MGYVLDYLAEVNKPGLLIPCREGWSESVGVGRRCVREVATRFRGRHMDVVSKDFALSHLLACNRYKFLALEKVTRSLDH